VVMLVVEVQSGFSFPVEVWMIDGESVHCLSEKQIFVKIEKKEFDITHGFT